MKKILYPLISLILLATVNAKAQDGFDQLIKSSPGDATKLLNAYAEPLFKGIGLGMNSGWTNTAKTKGLLRFELRITATAAFAPSSAKFFDVTQIGLSNNVRPAAGSGTITPTFIGHTSDFPPTLNVYDNNGQKVTSFGLPGSQISFTPTPQIQLTVGLPKNTDIAIRYVPKANYIEDIGSISAYGLGIKHDIAQDFGRVGNLIPFDLAIAAGYNRLNYSKSLDVRPENGALPASAAQSGDFSNQHFEGHFNSFNLQAMLSKQFLFFTPFISVGYNTANTNVGLLGNYPITTSATINQKFYTSYANPVAIDEKSVNGIRADAGFQLSLAIFKIYASYGIAEQYHMVNAGIGFGL